MNYSKPYILLIFISITLLNFISGQIEIVPFATGLSQPVDLVTRSNGGFFIVEKSGTIEVYDSLGNHHPIPYLDITDRVNTNANEQGLLGLAIHPDFVNSNYIFVNYIGTNDSTFISRFEVNSPDSADRSTEKIILRYNQPFTNHNGGDLLFASDGYLYISSGDGGSGGDPQNNAQNLNSLLGKILRIDVDNGDPYAIPPSNPYLGVPNTKEEIWAYGMRNPWRFSFDEIDQQIIAGDVGQNAWEEIDVFTLPNPTFPPNYGWRCLEGNNPFNMNSCDTVNTIYPIHEYPHASSSGCTGSVTGGIRYKGSDLFNKYGKYFFADFCTGFIATYDFSSNQVDTIYASSNLGITVFGEDINNKIYFADIFSGTIYRIENGITQHSVFQIDLDGAQASSTSSASGYGFAIYDSITQQVSVTGQFTELTGNATAAHVHLGQAGSNGGVIFPLQITNYGPDSIGFFGTSIISNMESIALLQTDGLYVNIHSTANPSGEIRGQLIRKYCPNTFNAVAPELPPGTYKFNSGIIKGSLTSNRNAVINYKHSVTLDFGTTIEQGTIFEILQSICP